MLCGNRRSPVPDTLPFLSLYYDSRSESFLFVQRSIVYLVDQSPRLLRLGLFYTCRYPCRNWLSVVHILGSCCVSKARDDQLRMISQEGELDGIFIEIKGAETHLFARTEAL